jgi:hypothetical protein
MDVQSFAKATDAGVTDGVSGASFCVSGVAGWLSSWDLGEIFVEHFIFGRGRDLACAVLDFFYFGFAFDGLRGMCCS